MTYLSILYQVNANDHQNIMKDAVKHLQNLPNDVTIISGDNQEVHTSKFILSMFSPNLHNLLSTPNSDYITLLIPDILASSIKTVVDIITCGACETKAEGLIQENVELLRMFNIALCHVKSETGRFTEHKTASQIQSESSEATRTTHEKLDISEEIQEAEDANSTPCDIIASEYRPNIGLKNVVEQEDRILFCDKCTFTTKFFGNLSYHKKSKHEGLEYVCDQCGYKSKEKRRLKSHINAIHKGIWYYCDKCNHKTATKIELKTHIEGKHEGKRYDCDKCEFSTTLKFSLKRHVQTSHEGLRYPCSQCEHKATQRGDLKRHINLHHSVKID